MSSLNNTMNYHESVRISVMFLPIFHIARIFFACMCVCVCVWPNHKIRFGRILLLPPHFVERYFFPFFDKNSIYSSDSVSIRWSNAFKICMALENRMRLHKNPFHLILMNFRHTSFSEKNRQTTHAYSQTIERKYPESFQHFNYTFFGTHIVLSEKYCIFFFTFWTSVSGDNNRID